METPNSEHSSYIESDEENEERDWLIWGLDEVIMGVMVNNRE
jgi:hypothetical protein